VAPRVVAAGAPRKTEAVSATRCFTAGGYRGKVLDAPVFARVEESRGLLRGRYFYERIGVDIALEGRVAEDGKLELREKYGAFIGRCDPATGALSGRWSSGGKEGAFTLEPIPPKSGPIAATKRFTARRPVKTVGRFGMKECKLQETKIELFGLPSREAEDKINGQGLEPKPGPWRAGAYAKEVAACEEGFEVETKEELVDAFDDFVTLMHVSFGNWDGAAHPMNAADFERTTFDARTGLAVKRKDVFSRDPEELARRCLAAPVQGEKTAELDAAMDISGGELSFDLRPDGARFFGTQYPHALAVLTGHGPTIPYSILLRDGYLRADSPVKRAWSTATPAKPNAPECPVRKSITWE
jgi:hypothetical protein